MNRAGPSPVPSSTRGERGRCRRIQDGRRWRVHALGSEDGIYTSRESIAETDGGARIGLVRFDAVASVSARRIRCGSS